MKAKASTTKKFRVQRRLNTDLPGLGKHGALDRRPYAPGEHGNMRRKPSEYSLRLAEKQKLIAHYGLRERQLQRFVRDSHRAGVNWISELSRRLELRLDNLVFRAQMATSVQAARQMVLHKHIMVNGRVCNIPSAVLKAGDEIQVKDASKEHPSLLQAQQSPRLDLPSFIEKNEPEKAKVVSEPNTADVPFNYNERLIAEYYATRGRK